MFSASVHHEICRLVSYWHTDLGLLGAKEERAQSALIICPLNACDAHKVLSLLCLCVWAGAVDPHFSSVPLGDRRHIDSSLGCLIPGAMLVGSFLGAFLCLFLSPYSDWNCVLPVWLVLLPGDLHFSLIFLFSLLLGLLVSVDKQLTCHFQELGCIHACKSF
jgi:hypothetical protein